ncbi:MAG: TetR/AcrR family transcriptional regulator [Gemmiger sp.]
MKREEKTELTRARIVKAALREFGAHGYGGGTLNRICAGNLSKGLVYHNFKDKDELYLTCVRASCDSLTAFMQAQPGTVELRQYTAARWRWCRANPDMAHIFFEALLAPPEALAPRIRECIQSFNDMNRQMYRAFLATVPLRDGVSADEALEYFCRIQELFNASFRGGDGEALDERIAAHETRIGKLFDLILYGIAKEEEHL